MRTQISKQGWSSRSIEELEYSLTLRTLDTNAATIVAINRCQYVQLLPARVVSVDSTPTILAIFSSCCYRAFALAQHLNFLVPSLKFGLNLKSQQFFMQFSILFSILFSFVVDAGPGQVMFSYLFSTACICIYIHVAPSARHGQLFYVSTYLACRRPCVNAIIVFLVSFPTSFLHMKSVMWVSTCYFV